MPGVFLNYRRKSAHGEPLGSVEAVEALYRRLVAHFGADLVFRDVDSIPAGGNYPTVLRNRVATSDVLLAVIHPGWADDSRLANDRDWVSMEIEQALGQPTTVVIPVLVDGAVQPTPAQLPARLAGLATRQAHPRGGASRDEASWNADLDRLIDELEQYTARSWSPATAPSTVSRPPGRAGTALLVVTTLSVLVSAALLVPGRAPGDSVPPAFWIAAVSLLIMLVGCVAVGLTLAGQRRITLLEGPLHRATPTAAHGWFSIPVSVAWWAVLLLVASRVGAPAVYSVAVAGLFGTGWLGLQVLRERELDRRLRESWPYRPAEPLTPLGLRRAAEISRERIASLPAHPVREQREKVEWSRDVLGKAARRLQEGPSRTEWLRTRWRATALVGNWIALTAGCLLALQPVLHQFAFLALLLAAVGLPALAAELTFRGQRRQRRAAADEVLTELAQAV